MLRQERPLTIASRLQSDTRPTGVGKQPDFHARILRAHALRCTGAMKLHAFLFGQLWNEGVRQIFGIPGDFVLNLYEALEADGRFQLIRLSHEPAVGFAADGAARITAGLGVCCVTYGAGGLNMINPVACAYAEQSPLVILSGGPGRLEKRAEVHVHHEVKSFESQLKVYQEVTEFAAILDDPLTAAAQIRKAIEVALKIKRPVYLEIPRDMVFADIVVPPIVEQFELKIDDAAVDEAAQEIIARLTAAERPVLIVGVEVHRFELRDQVIRLAERLQIPVASSFLGRGVFPTRHPQFIGTYLGVVSPQPLRERVERSDCILLLGEQISDTGLGISATRLGDANLLVAIARDVYIRHHRYQNTPLDRLVAQLLEWPDLRRFQKTPGGPEVAGSQLSPEVLEPMTDDEPIKVRHVIGVLNDFLADHQDLPIVADTGDCLFASVDVCADEIIAPAYYATMGFAIPAALGVQVASGRRALVLVGDGAFQMTGCEIAHAPEYHCNPIVVLFDNARWEMLQAFFPEARYNGTVAWPFATLAELWGGRGFDARTPRQLRDALAAASREDRFTLIDVKLQQGDVSPILRGFVSAFKQRVYSA
jgi:indolepyruvate decarboxylase